MLEKVDLFTTIVVALQKSPLALWQIVFWLDEENERIEKFFFFSSETNAIESGHVWMRRLPSMEVR